MKIKHLSIILLSAILIVCFALFIRLIQYEPLFPSAEEIASIQSDTPPIPLFAEDPIIGSRKALITLVAFEDLACGACLEQDAIFAELLDKHTDKIKIIWKGLPINFALYPSREAHRYLFCANEQKKFDGFKTLAFDKQSNLSPETLAITAKEAGLDEKNLEECLASGRPEAYIEMTEQLAKLLNIQSVPTIFLNNIQIEYPKTVEGWEDLLRNEGINL